MRLMKPLVVQAMEALSAECQGPDLPDITSPPTAMQREARLHEYFCIFDGDSLNQRRNEVCCSKSLRGTTMK
jgi:hypothetical protein